jgi:hypothetical protein
MTEKERERKRKTSWIVLLADSKYELFLDLTERESEREREKEKERSFHLVLAVISRETFFFGHEHQLYTIPLFPRQSRTGAKKSPGYIARHVTIL